jgi:hypothetical protein
VLRQSSFIAILDLLQTGLLQLMQVANNNQCSIDYAPKLRPQRRLVVEILQMMIAEKVSMDACQSINQSINQ